MSEDAGLTFKPGSLVRVRGRTCVVQSESTDELLIARPLGGREEETQAVYLPLGLSGDLGAQRISPPRRRRPRGSSPGADSLRRCAALLARDLRPLPLLRQAGLPAPRLPARPSRDGLKAEGRDPSHDRGRCRHRKDNRGPPGRKGTPRAGRGEAFRRALPTPPLRAVARGARRQVRHRCGGHPFRYPGRPRPRGA